MTGTTPRDKVKRILDRFEATVREDEQRRVLEAIMNYKPVEAPEVRPGEPEEDLGAPPPPQEPVQVLAYESRSKAPR